MQSSSLYLTEETSNSITMLVEDESSVYGVSPMGEIAPINANFCASFNGTLQVSTFPFLIDGNSVFGNIEKAIYFIKNDIQYQPLPHDVLMASELKLKTRLDNILEIEFKLPGINTYHFASIGLRCNQYSGIFLSDLVQTHLSSLLMNKLGSVVPYNEFKQAIELYSPELLHKEIIKIGTKSIGQEGMVKILDDFSVKVSICAHCYITRYENEVGKIDLLKWKSTDYKVRFMEYLCDLPKEEIIIDELPQYQLSNKSISTELLLSLLDGIVNSKINKIVSECPKVSLKHLS
jgi:hypothetical protein